jgi:SAM-dependent MidA family methyltransferase
MKKCRHCDYGMLVEPNDKALRQAADLLSEAVEKAAEKMILTTYGRQKLNKVVDWLRILAE